MLRNGEAEVAHVERLSEAFGGGLRVWLMHEQTWTGDKRSRHAVPFTLDQFSERTKWIGPLANPFDQSETP